MLRRQPLADARGVVVGVVVVRRGGHRWSSPEFVKHDLLLGGVERRARNGIPSCVDVLPCPALSDEGGEFQAFVFARDAWKQGERGCGVVAEMTIDALFDGRIIRACLLMQAGLSEWMRGHVIRTRTPAAGPTAPAAWR